MKIEYAIILASATLALGYKEHHDTTVCVNPDVDEYLQNPQAETMVGLNTLATSYINDTTCSGSIDAQFFTRFTAIFFGDFTTNGGQDILGPLAVAGRFTASSYTVNANHGSNDCSDIGPSLNSYGLVVGGEYDATDIHVHGGAFLPDEADATNIQVQTSGCGVSIGTGLFDFTLAYSYATYMQQLYASYEPTYQLSSDDTLTQLSSDVLGFAVITMDTCNDFDCPLYPGELSYPNHMILGDGNWNGVQGGGSFPDTLVINIPVDIGSTIVLKGNQPSMGLTVCRTIWNFYPSDSTGAYVAGRFTIIRETSGQFGGFILAPEANIIDGSTGNFAGLTIGHDYSWESNGVEIHDYQAVGGDCSGFLACAPLDPSSPDTPDDTTISISFTSTASESSSTSESSSSSSSTSESSSISSSTSESSSSSSSTSESSSSESSSSSSSTSESSSSSSSSSSSESSSSSPSSSSSESSSSSSSSSSSESSSTSEPAPTSDCSPTSESSSSSEQSSCVVPTSESSSSSGSSSSSSSSSTSSSSDTCEDDTTTSTDTNTTDEDDCDDEEHHHGGNHEHKHEHEHENEHKHNHDHHNPDKGSDDRDDWKHKGWDDNGYPEEDCEDEEDDYDDHKHDDDWEDDEDCDDEYDDHDSHGKWKKRDEIPNEVPESLAAPVASNSNIAADGLKQPAEAEMNEGSVLRRGISLIVPAFVAYYLH